MIVLILFILFCILIATVNSFKESKVERVESSMMTGSVFQILETLCILENTSNIETLISRYNFLLKKLLSIFSLINNPGYNNSVKLGIEEYERLYYDKKVTDEQIEILHNPSSIKNSIYYAKNIAHCFSSYCEKIDAEIKTLKKEDAKERRRTKVMEVARICIYELNDHGKNEYINSISEDLKRFEVHLTIKHVSK